MGLSGGLNLLKPPGMTSHDAVAIVRRVVREKRVGHAGTLDPAAAGVLPICIGEATKVAQFLQGQTKEYRAELILGVDTDSQDYTGRIVREAGSGSLASRAEVLRAVASFVGRISQVPPMVSAIKVDGRRCYDIARAGETVEREAREVTIESIRVLSCPEDLSKRDVVVLHVVCGKGTYIRALCSDVGAVLGCGAHMGFLLRTRVGDMGLATSFSLEELGELSEAGVRGALIPPDGLLSWMPALQVSGPVAAKARNGAVLPPEDFGKAVAEGGRYRVRDAERLLAIYECSRVGQVVALRAVRGFV